jgi:redox-sensitive bicupin YhaK (pirin superfamily)
VNLPADRKLVATRYQDLRVADQTTLTLPGVAVRVVSGDLGPVRGPAANHWPILGLPITLDPGSGYVAPIPAGFRAFAYVLAGPVVLAGRAVGTGEVAWSDPVSGNATSGMDLRAPAGDEPARVMLYAGRPIGEPMVVGGPFVMNTHAEIERAFADFHSGGFGPVPRQARLRSR